MTNTITHRKMTRPKIFYDNQRTYVEYTILHNMQTFCPSFQIKIEYKIYLENLASNRAVPRTVPTTAWTGITAGFKHEKKVMFNSDQLFDSLSGDKHLLACYCPKEFDEVIFEVVHVCRPPVSVTWRSSATKRCKFDGAKLWLHTSHFMSSNTWQVTRRYKNVHYCEARSSSWCVSVICVADNPGVRSNNSNKAFQSSKNNEVKIKIQSPSNTRSKA